MLCTICLLLTSCTAPAMSSPVAADTPPISRSPTAVQPLVTPAQSTSAEPAGAPPVLYIIREDAAFSLTPLTGGEVILPFMRRLNGEDLFGFCDISGAVLVYPVYTSVDRLFYGEASSEFVYAMTEADINGGSSVTLTSPDGSMVSGPYHNTTVADIYADEGVGYATLQNNDVYGLLRLDGTLLLDITYEQVSRLSEGLVAVKSQGVYAYLNATGDPHLFGPYQEAGAFSEGKAVVCSDDLWGVIDHSGLWLLPPSYDSALDFDGGVCAVKTGDLWGLIDETGAAIFPYNYVSITKLEPQVYSLTRIDPENPEQYMTFFYDTVTRKVIQDTPSLSYLAEGIWLNTYDDRIELSLERTGEVVSLVGAQWVTWVDDGLLEVGLQDMAGLYKIGQGFLVQPDQYKIQRFYAQDALIVVGDDRLQGVYNTAGREILPCEYMWIQPLGDSRYGVCQGNSSGVVDKNGDWLLQLTIS